jgi:hypothetical protein
MDFLEPQICRRRCDYPNDIENPLLEATSSTAEGEHEQETSSKEDPLDNLLMLAIFVALFLEFTICNLPSSQGKEVNLGGVIIPIVHMIVIAVGHFFLLLAIYYRFMNADVRDKAFFGIFFKALIFIGLAMEALSVIVATHRFGK